MIDLKIFKKNKNWKFYFYWSIYGWKWKWDSNFERGEIIFFNYYSYVRIG